MYKILINTADRYNKEVKLVDAADKLVAEKVGELDVVGAIQQLLAENHLSLNDISEIVPFLGPGSFTGLKMGVTVANVFNWLQGKRSLQNLDYPDYGGEPNITARKE
jgi:tRNA A37 threonylcarbamoyladenosine modification protein TsaB